VREQRVILKDEADVAPIRRLAGDILAVEADAPGIRYPAIIRSVVVLPQPEGPSSVRNSPGRTDSVTSRAA
jgi:hypothetical protein